MHTPFDHDEAFSRNLGWLGAWEQQLLRDKTVAIAGMGGVGGAHLLTLARLGIGGFHIADFDRFELANFNRQVGSAMSTVGRPKVEVMESMARDIDPDLRIRTFAEGIDATNVDAFLRGVDLYVDGLDTFALDARELVFERCAALGIPAATAAPIGMSVAYLVFMPGQMTFEQYFGWRGRSREEKLARLLTGLAPGALHMPALAEPQWLDLVAGRAPSTPMACQLCAGVVGTEAVKILLGRGKVRAAPCYQQFDAFTGRWRRGRLHAGHRNPLQTVKRKLFSMLHDLGAARTAPPATIAEDDIERILDLARWAPSGDNHQPWRFERTGPETVRVHLQIPEGDVYDLDGNFTRLAGGFLLETMRVAATRFGRTLRWELSGDADDDPSVLRIDVSMPRDAAVEEDPRCAFLRARSVNRNAYHTTPLRPEERRALEDALGPELTVRWLESRRERWRLTQLNMQATDIRLRIPEAHAAHQRIVDFKRDQSDDGIPAHSLGLDIVTLASMRWALSSFTRVQWMNRVAGTGLPRLQMDLFPGMACGAQFLVAFRSPPSRAERVPALLRAGMGLQRMWLEATRLGLAMQPGMAPLAFGRYGLDGVLFTDSRAIREQARALGESLEALWPERGVEALVFAGRLGTPRSHTTMARSVRKPLRELIVSRSAPKRDTKLAATRTASAA